MLINKKIISILCLLGSVYAECPDGYVECNRDVQYNIEGEKTSAFLFGQKGTFGCTPILEQQQLAENLCTYVGGGIKRQGEGICWGQSSKICNALRKKGALNIGQLDKTAFCHMATFLLQEFKAEFSPEEYKRLMLQDDNVISMYKGLDLLCD